MNAFDTWKAAHDYIDKANDGGEDFNASVILTKSAAVEYLELFYNTDKVVGIDYVPYQLMHESGELTDANDTEEEKFTDNAMLFTEVQYGDVDFEEVKRSGSRAKRFKHTDFVSFVNQWELWQVWTR